MNWTGAQLCSNPKNTSSHGTDDYDDDDKNNNIKIVTKINRNQTERKCSKKKK